MALPDEVDFVVKVESGRNLVDMNYTLDHRQDLKR